MTSSLSSKLGLDGHQKAFSEANVQPAEDSSSHADHSKPSVKASVNHLYLDAPLQPTFSRPSDDVSDISLYSADNDNERRAGRPLTVSAGIRLSSRSPAPPKTWRGKIHTAWESNKGLALVTLAQLFAVMMNVTTRLLEMDGDHGKGMHPFQILFARMVGTLVLSGAYQWLAKIEGAPFGSPEIRKLLIARGVGGFFGVYGMYASLQYLPLSDATVITFLAPMVACWACSVLIHEPFTRNEQIAAGISLFGVVMIARPTSLLSGQSNASPPATGAGDGIPSTNATRPTDLQGLDNVTPAQRLNGVGIALVGVLGAACAYTTIRWIGKRAHPLISVNYFSAWCTIVSTVALLAIPGIGFRLPASLWQWIYLLFLGISGFAMQFLLTAGLQHEKSSRATNMVYTQMLFALAFDKLVWNTTPGLLSIVGSSLILGSALYVAVYKNNKKEFKGREGRGDEEVVLATGVDDEEDDAAHGGRWPLRGVQEVQLRTLRV